MSPPSTVLAETGGTGSTDWILWLIAVMVLVSAVEIALYLYQQRKRKRK